MVHSPTLDRTFAALSDPTRREIIERLSAGPASISELAEPIGISLPGVLKHVRILEAAQLVTTSKRGRTRECRLAPGDMGEVADWIDHQRRRWEQRLDRLEEYLQETTGTTETTERGTT
jgi:DNA-binding transcriptional ArsR family regulator